MFEKLKKAAGGLGDKLGDKAKDLAAAGTGAVSGALEKAGTAVNHIKTPGKDGEAAPAAPGRPGSRVLIVVSGGAVQFAADPGIQCVIYNFDDHETNAAIGGVPVQFRDFAEQFGVPVADAQAGG